MAWANLARSLSERNRKHDALWAAVIQASVDPKDAFNWAVPALVAGEEGEYVASSYCYERALKLDKYDDLYRNYFVESLYESNQYARCISEGKKALKIFCNTRCYMEYIGLSYQKLKNRRMATYWFNRSKKAIGETILEEED